LGAAALPDAAVRTFRTRACAAAASVFAHYSCVSAGSPASITANQTTVGAHATITPRKKACQVLMNGPPPRVHGWSLLNRFGRNEVPLQAHLCFPHFLSYWFGSSLD